MSQELKNRAKSVYNQLSFWKIFQRGHEYGTDEVSDELADVFNYLFLMENEPDLDVNEIIFNKVKYLLKKDI